MRPIKAKPRMCLAAENYRLVALVVNSIMQPKNEKGRRSAPTARIVTVLLTKSDSVRIFTTSLSRGNSLFVYQLPDSQQLMTLRKAGLVADRKDGLRVYYRITDRAVLRIVDQTRAILERQGVTLDAPAIG